ncbi:hypothetical protein LEP1GSC186_4162 [Leptospira noguchii serovar Autumnalis str. ZUN142]|uniref:Uncharacterized protein n=1 Tax=Leptospira noguchii serovar Autumnalis str. ZUN142 TaxID=1085540 RepID=M6UBW9_9LEPT|nr:hypothetical protein LEP1GSC186_4162 [Leptospira noguchii serovar Autumnalis str. ZUN142]
MAAFGEIDFYISYFYYIMKICFVFVSPKPGLRLKSIN